MAREIQRKKILHLLKDLVNKTEDETPTFIADYILGQYGLTNQSKSETYTDHQLSAHVIKLEQLIEENCKTLNALKERKDTISTFRKTCESLLEAKSDFLQVSGELSSLLSEIKKFRERYSEHLMQKSILYQDELKVLEKKLHFFKLQLYHKLYGEKNAFGAHVRLKELLSNKLENLKLKYNELVELDIKYSELKNNSAYCDLLQTYKQLLIIEKKLDYMIEK